MRRKNSKKSAPHSKEKRAAKKNNLCGSCFTFAQILNNKIMSTEENNTAQNAPKTLPEIMEQLKSAVDKASQAVQAGNAIDPQTLDEIVELIHDAELLFTPFANTFTPKDRTRLVSGGIKNLGFIETAHESASNNPQFVPPYLNMTDYNESILDFTRKRSLFTLLQQFAQQVSDSMLLASDAAYHDALEYYNSVKEAARQRVPGAEAEYNLLSKYFKKSKPAQDGNAPTETEEKE
jgi:ABC-type transporter MlaC component